jgi:hypothetical protein
MQDNEGFQCAHNAWNDFMTEKYVSTIHDTLEVLMAKTILMVVFWIVIPCGLVGGYQPAPSTGKMQYAPLKIWNPSTHPQRVTTQKTITNMRYL